MKALLKKLQSDSWSGYFLTSLLLCFVFFPYFFLGLKSPMMAPHSWALSDTVVSHMVFIPGLKSFKFQLFHNGQILWNNLRAMGMPLLANEIQAAPLFPLTWLFLFLPISLFWNFFVIAKLLLASTFGIYIARRILGFNFYTSLFFLFNFCFGMYVLRYMNHPWHNAFIAGLLYWIFLDQLKQKAQSIKTFLGLSFSVYCLITAGFPSNSVLMGLLVTLIVVADGTFNKTLKKNFKWIFLTYLMAHVVGLCLGSSQVFSLLETLKQTAVSFRKDIGLYQVKSPILFLGMIFRFANGLAPFEIIHVFRILPIFFFVTAMIVLIRNRLLYHWDKIMLLVFAFAALKYFPIFPIFNKFMGSLPILDRTHFTIYGFCFFILPFSYFSARGLAFWIEKKLHSNILYASLGIVVLLIFGAFFYARREACEINPLRFALLIFPLSVLLSYLIKGRLFYSKPKGIFLLIAAFMLEFLFTQPSGFISTKDPFYKANLMGEISSPELSQQISPEEKINFRIQEANGVYADSGLATADVGATAILTERQQIFRNTLFEVPWEGYLPLEKSKFSYSNPLQATSFFWDSKNQKINKDLNHSRAYLASSCTAVENLKKAQEIFKSGSFKFGDLILEVPDSFCSSYQLNSFQNVKILEDKGNYIRFESISGPAYLVLSDTYFPGWYAHDKISGQKLPILAANLNFRALKLSEKRNYEIEYFYEPLWLKKSLLMLLFGFLLLGIYSIFLKRTLT